MSYGGEHGVTSQMPPNIVTGEMSSDFTDAPVKVTGSAPSHNYRGVLPSGSYH